MPEFIKDAVNVARVMKMSAEVNVLSWVANQVPSYRLKKAIVGYLVRNLNKTILKISGDDYDMPQKIYTSAVAMNKEAIEIGIRVW